MLPPHGVENAVNVKELLLEACFAHIAKKQLPEDLPYEERNDHYFVRYEDSRGTFLLDAKGCSGGKVPVEKWNGSAAETHAPLCVSSLNLRNVYVIHYYKGKSFSYSGLLTYIIKGLSRWSIGYSRLKSLVESFKQRVFNKKSLAVYDRLEVLRIVVNERLSGRERIGLLPLINRLEGTDRWILHPDSDRLSSRVEMILESFVATGELKRDGLEYVVNGRALSSLDRDERDERRHADMAKVQRVLVYLTGCLVVAGGVQAYATWIANV